jgi:hypothetical protein
MQLVFGDVRGLADDIGPDFIICEEGQNPRCKLRAAGFEAVPEATADLKLYAQALGVAGRLYRAGRTALTKDDLRQGISASEDELKRIGAMLSELYGPFQGGDYEGIQILLREDAFEYADVSDYPDTKRIKRLIDERSEKRHRKWYGDGAQSTRPVGGGKLQADRAEPRYQLSDAALNGLFQRDFRELGRVRDIGAWKAASLLAGSCVEAILLDLMLKHPDKVPSRFVNNPDWPRCGGLDELANAAAHFRLISNDHKNLSAFFKQWRDIVHPARAVRTKEPDKVLADALFAYLPVLMSGVREGNNGIAEL